MNIKEDIAKSREVIRYGPCWEEVKDPEVPRAVCGRSGYCEGDHCHGWRGRWEWVVREWGKGTSETGMRGGQERGIDRCGSGYNPDL